MRQIDNVVRKALNLEPLQPGATNQRTRMILFEENQGTQTHSIESEWYFAVPIVTPTKATSVDLQRLLKQFEVTQLDKDAHNLLSQFSQEANRLKQLPTRTEEELLCYLNFIDVLNKVFENNSTPYSYTLNEENGSCTIQSDNFLFEYLQCLLSLLAHYNNQAIEIARVNTAGDRELVTAQARYFHLCTEVLNEMLHQCRAPSQPYKLVYKEPLRSMGRDTVIASEENEKQQQTSIGEFISALLGGEASIQARIHLCTAKKQEALHTLSTPDNALPRISAIYSAYREAYLAIADSQSNRALYRHTRFMAHLWLCHAHLLIVKQSSAYLLEVLQSHEESAGELNQSRELLARLLYITDEASKIEQTEPEIVENLGVSLEQRYNALIDELNTLTQRFDTELYINRHVKEMKEIDFSLQPVAAVQRQGSLFSEARRNALKKHFEHRPAIVQAQQLLRSLVQKLSEGTAQECLKPALEEVEEAMDRSMRLGHAKERQWWLEWTLSLYSPIDGEFRLNAELHAVFLRELEALKTVRRQLK